MAEIRDDISSLSSADSDNDSASSSVLSYASKVTSNPMFYVLGQFLESPTSNKNIATLLEELIEEIRRLRESLPSASA